MYYLLIFLIAQLNIIDSDIIQNFIREKDIQVIEITWIEYSCGDIIVEILDENGVKHYKSVDKNSGPPNSTDSDHSVESSTEFGYCMGSQIDTLLYNDLRREIVNGLKTKDEFGADVRLITSFMQGFRTCHSESLSMHPLETLVLVLIKRGCDEDYKGIASDLLDLLALELSYNPQGHFIPEKQEIERYFEKNTDDITDEERERFETLKGYIK